jgi:hypothetical protein
MRFRLLRRRLTISAPSMTVRGALPWPLRWIALALMLGFSAAIGLWAFEFGKSIAGLDKDAKEELLKLRAEVIQLRQENDKNLSIVNTSGLTLVFFWLPKRQALEHDLAQWTRALAANAIQTRRGSA